MAKQPAALQLRLLRTVVDVAAEKNSARADQWLRGRPARAAGVDLAEDGCPQTPEFGITGHPSNSREYNSRFVLRRSSKRFYTPAKTGRIKWARQL
jgi:hypothetical protein